MPFTKTYHFGVRARLWGSLAVFVWCAAVPQVDAAVLQGGETFDLAPAATIDDDLYFAGSTLTLQGTTTGDVVAAGSELRFSGLVASDVIAAAGRVTLGGVVEGDARVAGGVVTVDAVVGEDLVVVGGTVTVGPEAIIKGDLVVYADRLVLAGVVEGVVESHVRSVVLTGSYANDVSVDAGESLSVQGDASVGGNLRYSAPREAFISDTATIAGEKVFTPRTVAGGSGDGGIDVAMLLLRLCMLVVAAVGLVWLFPRFTREAVEVAFAEGGGWHALRGFVAILDGPVIVLVMLLTLVGIVPGRLVLLVYLGGLLLALPLTAVFAGVMLARWLKREDGLRPAWASAGAISLVLVTLLPVIGWLVRLTLFCFAFGTLLMLAYRHIWQQRKESIVYAQKDSETSPPAG